MFTGSAAMAAGGLGLLAAPAARVGAGAEPGAARRRPWRWLAFERMTRRMGMTAEPYRTGRGGAYMRAGQVLGAARRDGGGPVRDPRCCRAAGRAGSSPRVSGAALLGASAATRWGVFHAGMASARDPKYTVVPQRQRLTEHARAQACGAAPSASLPA